MIDAYLLCVSVFSFSVAQAQWSPGFFAELSFPYEPDDNPLTGVQMRVTPAEFGYHDYGGFRVGFLVLPFNESYRLECTAEPFDRNPYIEFVESWNPEDDDEWLMLVDRGDCFFVDKVQLAESYGAAAVLVLDNRVEGFLTMVAPPNWDDDIGIPSMMLKYNDAALLMSALGVANWGKENTPETPLKYPSVEVMNWTVGWLEYGLPRPDDRVEYELWTSSNDLGAVKFKRNWHNTGVALDYANDTLFTPHMFVLNGSYYGCRSEQLPCGAQCTNSGRYCSPDESYDMQLGIEGTAVVTENLRQVCVWKVIEDSDNALNESIWWNYAIRWDANCNTNDSRTFTVACSEQQLDAIQLTLRRATDAPSLTTLVQNCVDDSGGVEFRGGVNQLLDYECWYKNKKGINRMPYVTVNEFRVKGSIDCEEITEAHCQVLDAICASFVVGTEPPVCFRTPEPTAEQCPDEHRDCAGVCYGRFLEDACGKCLQEDDTNWDACLGCDRVPFSNKTYDCTGDCGGVFAISPCGYCISTEEYDNATFYAYAKDCRGKCNGGYSIDLCGECLPENHESRDECKISVDRKKSNGITAIIVVSICAIILLCAAGFCLYRVYERQKGVDEKLADFAKRYKRFEDEEEQVPAPVGTTEVPQSELNALSIDSEPF